MWSSLMYFTDARKSAVEAASREAAKFKADCHDMLAWVNSAATRLSDAEAISSDPDTLRQQARQNRVSGPQLFPPVFFLSHSFDVPQCKMNHLLLNSWHCRERERNRSLDDEHELPCVFLLFFFFLCLYVQKCCFSLTESGMLVSGTLC